MISYDIDKYYREALTGG
jgi:hypothetical protein